MRINVWREKSLSDNQIRQIRGLVSETGIGSLLAKLYVLRGITDKETYDIFNNQGCGSLHDPFLYRDMDKAIERLNLAICRSEKILIYGDFDVDGVTSVSLVYRYLSNYYSRLGFYIPQRETEGYGVSMAGVDYAADNGFTLVIALDCGIKDVKSIKYAQSKNIDFIVCDHHNPSDELPCAVAVLDAKREDNTYPYTELSGCGVGYKLMEAFAKSNGYSKESLLPVMDVLAMSIASDIVPLTGENRSLLKSGLQRINNEPSVGVYALIEKCGLQGGKIGINDLVYQFGPRINAAGRIESADTAVKLLIAEDISVANRYLENVSQNNDTRRELDRETTKQALADIANDPDFASRCSTVVFNPEWKKGVVGIVASRIIETYYKPTVVLTGNEEIIHGSARSVAGFDLYSAIKACESDLVAFGGHDFAAGLSLRRDKLGDFKAHFEEYVSQHITEEQKVPVIEYDTEISFSDISRKFFDDLQLFQPFGPENPQPVFVTRGVYNVAATRLVGQESEHLRLEVSDGSINDKLIGIAFNMKDFYAPLYQGKKVDICYTIEENIFRGRSSLQLMVRDIKLSVES